MRTKSNSLAFLLLTAGLAWEQLPAAGEAAAPMLEKVDLFEAGQGGYAFYRIPGVTVTAKGTVLAYCEARRTDRSDWSTMDVLLRRSTDGGKTWEPAQNISGVPGPKEKNPAARVQKLGRVDGFTYNNPIAIADRDGAVHVLFCLEYMRCFYRRSDDDGKTFSAPVEITATFDRFRPEYDWKVLSTGPGHGIQLRSGRLVATVRLSRAIGRNALRPTVATTIYSDDGGKSWARGEIAVPNTADWVNPNEPIIAELGDGRVMLNVRNEGKPKRRLVTTSPDGAKGWSTPRFDAALLDSGCMAGLVTVSRKATSDKSRLLFSNPHDVAARKNLSLKLSYDEGETWPVNQTLEEGLSAYSDVGVLPDGTMVCFYERGSPDGKELYGRLTVARFNLEWLTGGRDSLPRRP